MTSPSRRSDSRRLQFKKRTPKSLLAAKGEVITLSIPNDDGEPIIVRPKIGEFIKCSLHTSDDRIAKARTSAIELQLAAIEKTAREPAQKFSFKQAVALAGEAYAGLINQFEQNPGNPAKHMLLSYGLSNAPYSELPIVENYINAEVAGILSRRNIRVDDDTRQMLTSGVRTSLALGFKHLERNAQGDYRPDPEAQRFPKFDDARAAAKLSISGIFEAWAAEAKLLNKSDSTLESYGRTFRYFRAFVGHNDARKITHDDVKRFKDKRLADGLSPITVDGSDLCALKVVFKHAMKEHADFTTNPAEKVAITLTKKFKQGRKLKGYSDEGAITLLRGVCAHTPAPNELPQTTAAKRWAHWIAAHTGMRIGEVVQLRRKDVFKEGEIWGIWILPEAGTVKGDKPRKLPVHPQLIELGFIDFVSSAADGYLFLNAETRAEVKGKLNAIKNRLCDFAKEFVVEDKVPPNHGWRHRFITVCRRHEMSEEKRRCQRHFESDPPWSWSAT